ncbi:MAG: alpha/beta hydrolase [Bacteroidota bacterium]
MLKKFLIGFAVVLAILVAGYFFYINSGMELPPETDAVVEKVMAMETLPELVTGESGYAENEGVKIWYEKKTPIDSMRGTILLIMGHSSTGLIWSNDFCQPFLDAGYQVIRYDNRGVGNSDWIDNWDEDNPYDLEDMAKDGMAVLDAVGVEKAHIVGASMGGMIAQRVAISHADRVASLTSIMSSGYMFDPEMPQADPKDMQDFIKLGLKYLIPPTEEGAIRFSIGIPELLRGSGDYVNEYEKTAIRTLYELRKRKGFNPSVGDHHTAAIQASGSRLDELGQIKVPTLIIHGKSDPLVLFEHCQKYAPLIPQAKKLYIDGMGHDLPKAYYSQIHPAILRNIVEAS